MPSVLSQHSLVFPILSAPRMTGSYNVGQALGHVSIYRRIVGEAHGHMSNDIYTEYILHRLIPYVFSQHSVVFPVPSAPRVKGS